MLDFSNVPPALYELVKILPPAGSAWPDERRELWLDTARNILRLVYSTETERDGTVMMHNDVKATSAIATPADG